MSQKDRGRVTNINSWAPPSWRCSLTKGKRSFPCLSFSCRINWVWKATEERKRRERKKKSRDFPHSLWALGVSFSVPQTRTKMFSTLISLNPTAHFRVSVCIMFRPVDTVRKKWQTPYSSSSNSSVLLFYACWYLFFSILKCYACSLGRFYSFIQWKGKFGLCLLHFYWNRKTIFSLLNTFQDNFRSSLNFTLFFFLDFFEVVGAFRLTLFGKE